MSRLRFVRGAKALGRLVEACDAHGSPDECALLRAIEAGRTDHPVEL